MHLETHANIRRGCIERRNFLKTISLAGLGLGVASFTDALAASADELRQQGMACILLWMQGGPSQFETFDPKPSHANGGETKAISTNVPGIEISENLPEVAQVMDKLCVIRSLNSKEGSHPRATYLMHTGYLPTASIKYPTLGSLVAHEIGDQSLDLPSFVRIGNGRLGDSAGFMGAKYDPFMMPAAGRLPENTTVVGGKDRYQRRLSLLSNLEADFADKGGKNVVEDHRSVYESAAKMVLSPRMDVFDLSKESPDARELYGNSPFGQGCLLARRLVESGITFVEVVAGNWDTHDNNFERSKELCGQIDRPFAALVKDLAQRGMLDRTLVVWMGEFGRTPRINGRSGRDHYPRAFCGALAGGGVKGGQVIGKTSPGGETVVDRPVSVSDMLRTVCHSLKIDADKENMSNIGRPIRVVDGGETVKEAFG
jgi:hypothetical protein